MNAPYNLGDTVTHDTYGEGTVIGEGTIYDGPLHEAIGVVDFDWNDPLPWVAVIFGNHIETFRANGVNSLQPAGG